MTSARNIHRTYEDYLHAREMSTIKLEYCDGEIYAMAGGTPAHAELTASMIAILVTALRGRCRVSSPDQAVRIEGSDLTTYADATVVCGERETSPIDKHAVTNPTILVEVSSPSTEEYDRGAKLEHYQRIPGLQAVVFVSHRRPLVTVVQAAPHGWAVKEYPAGTQVEVQRLVQFSVDEVYDGIRLD